MPWVRAKLREQLVYARANTDGSLRVERGSVEVRYKPRDSRKYLASAANLKVIDPTLLPDDICAETEAVERGPHPAQSFQEKTTPAPAPAGTIVAYTDGACSGNPGPAGLGVVWVSGDQRTELSEYLGFATNNIAELTAVLRALEHAGAPETPLIIHTDSQYSIGVLTKGWKAKANADLVASIRAALAARPGVRLVYVPGHAGVPLNERADELARIAIATRRTQTLPAMTPTPP